MTFRGELHPYQTDGVARFIDRHNLLIAWEMGLGKTVGGIAAAETLLDDKAIETCLIVCPASLKYQWAEKIGQFTDLPTIERKVKGETIVVPSRDCLIIDGTKPQRKVLYDVAGNKRPRYIIMGYENVINDGLAVSRIRPGMVILDEATAIKTFKAQRTKQTKKILKSEFRLALTGTPVENRPDELYSIMQWVDDTVLGRYDLFDKAYIRRNKYGWPVAYKNLPVLRAKMGPALSRRSRKDPEVAPYLPLVDEDEWYVSVNREISTAYGKIATDLLAELDRSSSGYANFDAADYYGGVDESTPSGKMMAMYMCLEMLLDHPDLLILSGQRFKEGYDGSRYAYELWQSGALDDAVESPKLTMLVDKLSSILAFEDSKVIIFTYYRDMLDIIEDTLPVPCVQFHGGLNAQQKASAIAKFTNDPACRVFLSSHAGAYGIDMSMANYLINFDLPWSAGKQDQINGRHVRASSEFDQVYIRNLIVQNGCEERKMRKLGIKRRAGSAILDGHGADSFGRIDLDGDSLKDHLTDAAKHGIM